MTVKPGDSIIASINKLESRVEYLTIIAIFQTIGIIILSFAVAAR